MSRLTPAQINLLRDIEEQVAEDPDSWDDWFEILPGELRTAEALARKGKLELNGKEEMSLTRDPRER